MFDWHYSRAGPEAAPPEVMPGQRFGPYEVLEELGRGGMGVVLRAREPETGREVALKVVLEDGLTEDRTRRFLREGELTARLVHPGIVRVHAAGEIEGRLYLAYELVEGCAELSDAWEGLERSERVRQVIDAAQALGYAHSRGVIHRDVKPANVLVDAGGRVKVADFGLATAAEVERLTQTGAVLGTPTHMSPEQFAGAERDQPVGPASDVWSLGVMLYTALTDELPFQGVSLYELCARVMTEAHRPVRQVDGSVSAGLAAVCDQALQKDPRDRYPDAAALADDLDRALRGQRPRAAARGGQRRLLAGLAALAALVALVLAGVLSRGPDEEALRERVAELDASTARLLRSREPLASDAGERARLGDVLEAVRAKGASAGDLRLSAARLEALAGLEACTNGDVPAARAALERCGDAQDEASKALRGALAALDARSERDARAAELLLSEALDGLRRPELLAWRGVARRKRGPPGGATGSEVLADLRPLAEGGPLAGALREAQLWGQVWRGEAQGLDAALRPEAPADLRHAAALARVSQRVAEERYDLALAVLATLDPCDPGLLGPRRRGLAARCRQLAQEVEGLHQASDQNRALQLATPPDRIAHALLLAQRLEPETPIADASVDGLIYASQLQKSPRLAALISRLVPDDWDRHFSLIMVASLFKRTEQGEDALRVIRRGVALAPTLDAQVGAETHLCRALLRLRRYEELRAALADVLPQAEESPLRGNLLLMRAELRRRDGDRDGAEADIREAKRLMKAE